MSKIIYVFNGNNNRFPSAVFDNLEKIEEWISLNRLDGILTFYPINLGIYDWAIQKDYFSLKKEEHKSADFIANFSSSSQNHFHYENGIKVS